MPRCATGARGSSRTGSAAAANAWCADGLARPGRHVLVDMLRDRPAARALRHHIGHRPDRDPPARLTLDLGHPHARHPEQRRRRILGRRGSRAVPDSHKSGSWDPRPRTQRNDTPRNATTRSQPASRRHSGIGQTFISRAVTSRIPAHGLLRRPPLRRADGSRLLAARWAPESSEDAVDMTNPPRKWGRGVSPVWEAATALTTSVGLRRIPSIRRGRCQR